jgi:hypothetical protein
MVVAAPLFVVAAMAAATLSPARALGTADHCLSACSGVAAPQDEQGRKELAMKMSEACAEIKASAAPELRVCQQFFDKSLVMACELACIHNRNANTVSTTREFGELRRECEQYRGGSRGPKAMRACQLGVQGGLFSADKGFQLRASIEATCASDPKDSVGAAVAKPVKAVEPTMVAAAAEPVKKAAEPVKQVAEPVKAVAEPIKAAEPVKSAAPTEVIADIAEMEAELLVVEEVVVPKKLRKSAA